MKMERLSLLATPCARAPFRHAFLAKLIEALEEEVDAGLLPSQAKRIFEKTVLLLARPPEIRGTEKQCKQELSSTTPALAVS